MNADELLKRFSEIDSIALDVVLQFALCPVADGDGFHHVDAHAVVGTFVRRLIRDEPVTELEEKLALLALADLPLVGEGMEGAIAR